MFGIADQATIEIFFSFLDALNESVFTQIDEFASSERLTKTGNIAKTRKED